MASFFCQTTDVRGKAPSLGPVVRTSVPQAGGFWARIPRRTTFFHVCKFWRDQRDCFWLFFWHYEFNENFSKATLRLCFLSLKRGADLRRSRLVHAVALLGERRQRGRPNSFAKFQLWQLSRTFLERNHEIFSFSVVINKMKPSVFRNSKLPYIQDFSLIKIHFAYHARKFSRCHCMHDLMIKSGVI